MTGNRAQSTTSGPDTMDPAAFAHLPPDRPHLLAPGRETASQRYDLAAAVAGSTARVAAEYDVTQFELLLAAFIGVVFRYSAQPDLAVGARLPGDDRTLFLSVHAGDDPTLDDLLGRIRQAVSAAPAVDSDRIGIIIEPAGHHSRVPELLVRLELTPGMVAVEVVYRTDLYSAGFITNLLRHYETLLTAAVAEPRTPLSRLPLLTVNEQRVMLTEWNATAVDFGEPRCLHVLISEAVARNPDAVAVICGERWWTYRSIDEQSDRLARSLVGQGLEARSLVALFLRPGPRLLVGILGVLKAGCAYVPLDVEYPPERLAFMLRESGCALVIGETGAAERLSAPGVPVVSLDAIGPGPALSHRPDPDDLAYVIYTSGSTGEPKGILVRHRGVVNNLLDLNQRFGVGPGDRVLALSSTSFDMSVYELLGTMIAGATVVIPVPESARDPRHWLDLIDRHQVTVWNSAPVLLDLAVRELEQRDRGAAVSLRLAMLGGDWIPVTLPGRLRTYAPDLRFIALGGATEASIHSTVYEVDRVDPQWSAIPYGVPMANQRTYVLDAALQPVPVGVAGQLCLAGTGLARGYLNRPELTAERFVTWSSGPIREERIYLTGDLARYRPDGVLELLGRMDFQVKIHGVRIELGEVEAALSRHPQVERAIVTAAQDATGDRRLVAFLEPADGAIDLADVRSSAEAVLPRQSVPAEFVVVQAFPLNPNGKVSRRALTSTARNHLAGGRAGSGSAAALPSEITWRESLLAELFAQVLGVRAGLHDSFLALGGDSLKVMKLVSLARAAGFSITFADVFRHRTVAGLAKAVPDGGLPASPGSHPGLSLDQSELDLLHSLVPEPDQ